LPPWGPRQPLEELPYPFESEGNRERGGKMEWVILSPLQGKNDIPLPVRMVLGPSHFKTGVRFVVMLFHIFLFFIFIFGFTTHQCK
jgi:hypothetical protein